MPKSAKNPKNPKNLKKVKKVKKPQKCQKTGFLGGTPPMAKKSAFLATLSKKPKNCQFLQIFRRATSKLRTVKNHPSAYLYTHFQSKK
jgi:hypothetical protein